LPIAGQKLPLSFEVCLDPPPRISKLFVPKFVPIAAQIIIAKFPGMKIVCSKISCRTADDILQKLGWKTPLYRPTSRMVCGKRLVS
jgi:hypothetical protein